MFHEHELTRIIKDGIQTKKSFTQYQVSEEAVKELNTFFTEFVADICEYVPELLQFLEKDRLTKDMMTQSIQMALKRRYNWNGNESSQS